MGCISSKLSSSDRDLDTNNIVFNHVVSLTSSTYGALNLDRDDTTITINTNNNKPNWSPPEIINAWELMKGLDDETSPVKNETKHSDVFTPVKKPNSTPRRRFIGKENSGLGLLVSDSGRLGKPFAAIDNNVGSPMGAVRYKCAPVVDLKIQVSRRESGVSPVSRRRSLTPLFDPVLLDSLEKEYVKDKQNVRSRKATELLEKFDNKCCPPRGENTVVLYTTTLRGIRKTFEDCNVARSVIESYGIWVVERDISMDSGYREELRVLMGSKEVKVPIVFVKGRLIGGADQLLKLEEEGNLDLLFEGLPRATTGCDGCGGMRFVMCMDCNGSRKILDEDQNNMVKCGECNENGLIHCPICC